MPNIQIETLTATQCIELISQESIGRVGVTVGALPVILPVRYALVGGSIIFRALLGSKLASATNHTVVAFEVDASDADGISGWSVLVQGMADEVTDPTERDTALAAPVAAWSVDGRLDRVVRVDPQLLSGRRFVRESA